MFSCPCQPRIACLDSQRETSGWDGPGAYEWDEALCEHDIVDNPGDDVDEDVQGGNKDAFRSTAGNGGNFSKGDRKASPASVGAKGIRPRGICVHDPDRMSPVFREGPSAFISPCQTDVRTFPDSPTRGRTWRDEQKKDEQGDFGAGNDGCGSPGSSWKQRNGEGTGRRKKPRKVRPGSDKNGRCWADFVGRQNGHRLQVHFQAWTTVSKWIRRSLVRSISYAARYHVRRVPKPMNMSRQCRRCRKTNFEPLLRRHKLRLKSCGCFNRPRRNISQHHRLRIGMVQGHIPPTGQFAKVKHNHVTQH